MLPLARNHVTRAARLLTEVAAPQYLVTVLLVTSFLRHPGTGWGHSLAAAAHMMDMTSPSIHSPWRALDPTPLHRHVKALRERTARFQVHPLVTRARSTRAGLPVVVAVSVVAFALFLYLWAQLAYLAGDTILGNLLMLVLGFAAVATPPVFLAITIAIVREKLRGRWR